jgi:hypothetical protein
MGQMQLTNHEYVLSDAGLAAMYEVFDNLHSAASEGELHTLTALNNRELVGWLRELVYTAQETITEIEKYSGRPKQPTLRLVK